MNTEEPVDTMLPWARKREPMTQVEYERLKHAEAVRLQPPAGMMTAEYEPNRPVVSDAQSIIDKKGLRAPDDDPVTAVDKFVGSVVCGCIVAIVGIVLYLLLTLG